jgi:mono/diheme cytochrome c family protein
MVVSMAGCEQKTPGEIRARLHLPAPDHVADVDRGRREFRRACARCHGRSGGGSSSGPPLVHATYEPSHHPDAAFHLAVRNGVQQHHWNFGNMPPQAGVSAESTADITAYIRYLQRLSGID